MKILFDLSAIYDHLTGIERYAINISQNIILSHPEDEYILIFKNEVHNCFSEIAMQKNVEVRILRACHKLAYYQWRLMRELYRCQADRYVFLSFVSPWLFRSKNIINTIHDISAWDCPSSNRKLMVWYGKIGIVDAIKKSKAIVTVSEFSKSRIVDRLGADREKVYVAYNGVSAQFLNEQSSIQNEAIREKYNLPQKYILCLSTLEPRKNMRLLIDAYIKLVEEKAIDCDLVLAGRKGWKLEDAVGSVTDRRIHLTGFVDDSDLPAVYRLADMFVFPSVYEGFGIPIIEAMSQGTVVISSDSSSLPEVIGDAGILFKNNSMSELKKAICTVASMEEEEKRELIQKGYERMSMFSWENEAEKYYKIIEA